MAARILGVKRPLDLEGLNDALPPTTCSGAAHLLSPDIESESFLTKRARMIETMTASASAAGVPITTRENVFPKTSPVDLDEELEGVVAALQSPSKRDSQSGLPATSEKKYSLDDVKAIVSKVVGQRESTMREEYNRILHAKLAEQFSSFTKFNQDYISRMVKGNNFSYVS